MSQREKALEAAASFLLDRLHEYELTDDADEMCRDFIGHIDPAMAKMSTAIAMPATVDRASWEAGRVPLDELHADASYLAHRVHQGSLHPVELADVIRSKIEVAIRSLTPPEDAP
jgi:hypothetical protein